MILLVILVVVIVSYLIWKRWFRTDYNQLIRPHGKNDDNGPVGSGVPLRPPPITDQDSVEKLIESEVSLTKN